MKLNTQEVRYIRRWRTAIRSLDWAIDQHWYVMLGWLVGGPGA